MSVRIKLSIATVNKQQFGSGSSEGRAYAHEQAREGGIKEEEPKTGEAGQDEVDGGRGKAEGVEEATEVVLRAEERDAIEDFAPRWLSQASICFEETIPDEGQRGHGDSREAKERRDPYCGLEHRVGVELEEERDSLFIVEHVEEAVVVVQQRTQCRAVDKHTSQSHLRSLCIDSRKSIFKNGSLFFFLSRTCSFRGKRAFFWLKWVFIGNDTLLCQM